MSESARAQQLALAEAVRRACIDAARNGYRRAAISGLCPEGAQEAALGAIEMANLEPIIAALEMATSDHG
ncbi:MAG: acetyltransferase [Gammaproteobacteria bacterium]|nr:acetyltransferase [Gammaproteobacteria bacterium]